MVKYYTAIGRYELRRDESGFDAPVLIRARKEYQPGIGEMLLWSRLAWQIREVNDLKADFEKKRAELRVPESYSFEYYLRRLEDQGFIRSGKGYTAADALYALVAPLNLTPLHVSIFPRVLAFLKLVLLGRLPVGVALQVFAQPELSKDEKLAMQMLRHASFSTAELIACIDLKQFDCFFFCNGRNSINSFLSVGHNTPPVVPRSVSRRVFQGIFYGVMCSIIGAPKPTNPFPD